MMKSNEFGKRIKKWRVSSNLTQAECAAYAGCNRPQWSYWENGYRVPTLHSFIRISKVLMLGPESRLALLALAEKDYEANHS